MRYNSPVARQRQNIKPHTTMDITKETFELMEGTIIPQDVCDLAREILTEFEWVFITRDNGEWSAHTGIGIQRHYAHDHVKIRLFAKQFRKKKA